MKNSDVQQKLLGIKRQITELGHEFIGSKSKIPLDDVPVLLKPFVDINSAVDKALKKFSTDVIPGSIPKQSELKS